MRGHMLTAVSSLAGHLTGEQQIPSRLSSALLAIAPVPTRVLISSSSLSWPGALLIEKHSSAPGDRASTSIGCHVLSMATGAPFRVEYRKPSGEIVADLTRPGSVTIAPTGPVPAMRFHEQSELTHYALENSLINDVVNTMEGTIPPAVFRSGIQEKATSAFSDY